MEIHKYTCYRCRDQCKNSNKNFKHGSYHLLDTHYVPDSWQTWVVGCCGCRSAQVGQPSSNPHFGQEHHRAPLSSPRVTQLPPRRQAQVKATPQRGKREATSSVLTEVGTWRGARSGASPGGPWRAGGRDARWVRASVTAVSPSGPCFSSCRSSRRWSPTRSPGRTRWQPRRLGPASW